MSDESINYKYIEVNSDDDINDINDTIERKECDKIIKYKKVKIDIQPPITEI